MSEVYKLMTIEVGQFVVYSRGAKYDGFSGQFFRIFEIIIFCFVVAMCDIMHDVDAIHGLC